jgi:predicted DNA-binding mobile mystery protein A
MKPAGLARAQVDRRLSPWVKLDRTIPTPGWIKTIRRALGMSGSQLGNRINVTRQAVAAFEADERAGSITLAALRKVAAAMNCDLVYALVPKDSLHATIEGAANAVARAELNRVRHTMSLEAQGTNAEAYDELVRDRISELMQDPRQLWRQSAVTPRRG